MLATAVVGLASLELFQGLQRRGFRPATILAVLGSIAIVPIAYQRGEFAFPFTLAIVTVFTLLWYLFEVVRARPIVNVAVTIMGFVYVGCLGAFAGLLLSYENGVGLILGVVLCVVGYDIVGYVVGSQFGQDPARADDLAEQDVEGLVGGMVASIVVAVVIVNRITPWNELTDAPGARHRRGDHRAARRPLRVDAQARPRGQGLRDAPARPRRDPRPLRRDPVLPAGGLLPRPRADDRLMAGAHQRRPPGLDGVGRDAGARRHPGPSRRLPRSSRSPRAATRELLDAQADEFGVPRRPGPARAATTPDVLAELAALPEADVVLNAVVGFAGLPATLAALDARQAARAREQGEPDRRRSGRGQGPGRAAAARSSRSTPSTPRSTRRCGPGAPSEVANDRSSPRAAGPFRGQYPGASSPRSPSPTRSKHPTWNMGAKITIDSSTLMNKGLEVIEAHELFGVDFDQIEVVVHPQSVVHGMVEFTDGATIAQLSMPDMRLPIGLALGAPHRLDQPFGAIDWTTLGSAHLRAPGPRRLPVPAPRLRRRPGRWGRPGGAERGQRGGGRGLPRRPDPVAGHRRDRRRGAPDWDRERR